LELDFLIFLPKLGFGVNIGILLELLLEVEPIEFFVELPMHT
jgi:hypothetical protein